MIRSEWYCEGCAVNGEAPHEFTDKSPYAHFDKVVIAKGTQEKPKGKFCLKCFYVWSVGGWKEECGGDFSNFVRERDRNESLAGSWTDCCSMWLEAHNAGK